MKIAIIWNRSKSIEGPTNKLKKALFQLIIKPHLKHQLFRNGINGVSEQDLDLYQHPESLFGVNESFIGSSKLKEYQIIFILAELDWLNHELSDFFGLKICQKLRLSDIDCPIFICSFVPEAYLVKEEQFKLLNFRGHNFIQLPDDFDEDTEITGLDKFELLDCKTHFCGIEGQIREIYHRKQHVYKEDDLDKAKEMVIELFKEIKQIKDLPLELLSYIEGEINKVKQKENIKDLKLFLRVDVSGILSYLKGDEQSKPEIPFVGKIEGNWKILILEDVPDDVKVLINGLMSAGFSEDRILLAATYEEAHAIINDDDVFNFITVVISDYRLEKDKKLKGKQGYSFVHWLSQQNRFNEIFVYSGLDRRFLKDTFKQFNVRVNIYSKNDDILPESGVSSDRNVSTEKLIQLVEEIIEKGNEQYLCLLHQPSIGVWNYSLNTFYTYYRRQLDYHELERKISYEAKRYINQIKYYLDYSYAKKDNKPNLQRDWLYVLLADTQIVTPFKKLTSDLFNSDKTPKDPEERNFYYYDIFKNILTARRVELYFMGYEESIKDRRVMAGLLMDGQLQPKTNNSTKQLYDHLCIGESDYPSRILVEERTWFNSVMKIDIDDPKSVAEKENIVFFEFVIELLNKLIEKSKPLIIDGLKQSDEFGTYIIKDGSQLKVVCNNIKDLQHFFVLLKEFLKNDFNLTEKLLKIEEHAEEIFSRYNLRP